MFVRKKLLVLILVLLILIVAMHFVPIYNKTGIIDPNNEPMGACLVGGVSEPTYYRVIPNGLKGFDKAKKYFIPARRGTTCLKTLTLRLYLW